MNANCPGCFAIHLILLVKCELINVKNIHRMIGRHISIISVLHSKVQRRMSLLLNTETTVECVDDVDVIY